MAGVILRAMLTSRPTHGGGAPFGVDLDAGIAKITVRRPTPAAEPATEDDDRPAELVDETPDASEQPRS
jgi:hypothetical protein